MTLDLANYLDEQKDRVNRALASVLDDYLDGVDPWLTEPIRYACEGAGKRFRPVLFLACYKISGREPNERVERLATALEIVHAYSLVHDDLPCMDDDDWRRGRPTCHRTFGVERATIAAAAMVPLAGWVIASEARSLGFDAAQCALLVEELSDAAGPIGMVGGQALDLIAEGQVVTGEQLAEIHQRKTGALIRVSARLGAHVGRVEPHQLDAITRYGEEVGLAFQIADDILDEQIATSGTDPRSDQELRKATYPGVHGTEEARIMARKLAEESITTLRGAGIASAALERLAMHVVERES
jgi:geranylgeranyl pyrophosphate synthase